MLKVGKLSGIIVKATVDKLSSMAEAFVESNLSLEHGLRVNKMIGR